MVRPAQCLLTIPTMAKSAHFSGRTIKPLDGFKPPDGFKPSHGLRVEHTLANKIRSLSGFALGLRSREAVMVHGPRRLGCLKQGLKPSDALRVRVCDRNSSLVCRTVGYALISMGRL